MLSQQREVEEMLNLAPFVDLVASSSLPRNLQRLLVDSNLSEFQRRRVEFFADEATKHRIAETDGVISGHEALKEILKGHKSSLGSAPIIFNISGDALTGSILSYRFYRQNSNFLLIRRCGN
jgi:hypothetical protein